MSVFKLKIGLGSSVLVVFIGLILQKPTGFVQLLFDRGKNTDETLARDQTCAKSLASANDRKTVGIC